MLALRPQIRALAQTLALALPSGEVVDFAERFASPYASGVIARLLGVPDEDHERFRVVSKDAGLVFAWSDLTSVLPTVESAIVELGRLVHELFASKAERPGDDLTSYLLEASAGDEALSREEAEHLVLDIAWASQESVAQQLGRALIAFRSHPRQWDDVARSPALAERAADEALRWAPQIRILFRFALEELRYRDLAVDRDQLIMFCPPSASRDPRAYDNADEFDIEAGRDARQLVFGGGVFRCPGAVLARLELEEALAALAPRFRSPTLPDLATARAALPMVNLRHALPIRWERREAGAAGGPPARTSRGPAQV
ncbi:hypothetical protein HMPREF9336_00914 [Segniliparus rugosus ATCC BAA-974]|uniref:Cytochrome P450 n=1 Tax=Segniliparus rugosus (strain ATCC BAA-974 / DSM 45345 / CCUG 50838 / CIP 108380 / JCM 13579 / CDC 945) TaxID=679197 RepID=E5XN44_SEGRC|nr:hypothetical protein HMPREF9336_00914 [Segniliparus rugosus ATCC BAA-974]